MYYKVVGYNLSSAYVGSSSNKKEELVVYYSVGEWTYPNINGTDLMVFSCLETAKYFMYKNCWGNQIFECEVLHPRKIGLFISNANVNNILLLAKLRLKHKKFMNMVDIPTFEDTIFCKAVKLLRLVEKQ